MNSALFMLLMFSINSAGNLPPLNTLFVIANNGDNLVTNNGDYVVAQT